MPDIVVLFSQSDIAELVAKAATLTVRKDGLVANTNDVVFELTDPSSNQQLLGARVRVRNVSPR